MGIIDSVFDSYRPKISDEIQARDKGSLLAFADGGATTFGIEAAQNRGKMFVEVGDDVYKGMIIGIHQRPGDLEVNVCKTKQLNNMRAASKDSNAGVSQRLICHWMHVLNTLQLTKFLKSRQVYSEWPKTLEWPRRGRAKNRFILT